MSVTIDVLGHGHQTVELPTDGKVTGTLNVVWLARGRATVQSGTVTYRGREFAMNYARFELSGDEWVFIQENMMTPVRNGSMSGGAAAPTFRDAVLFACSEALKAAYSVETARLVGRTDVEREIREAEMEETRLAGELSAVREKLQVLHKQWERYTD